MMVAPAVVVVSSPVDIISSSNQQGKPLVIRQPTQHYPHRPILEAPLAFLPAPCHLEIPPPFKGDCGRPVCDSAAFSTDSDITPPTTPTLTTATTATTTTTVATTTTTTTTATTTTTTDNNMKFLSSTNSSSVSSSYTHGESHFPNAHPEPIPYLPNHHHYHHHEEEEEEEREHVHQCEHAHHEEEEEYIIPWQEEMRRVEAARYRRDLIEAKRTRQAAQRKLQQQQQQKQQQQARQWVWVVDEEIEAVQEADVIVPRSKVFSWGGRVKDVWRKVFSGKRRLSEHEMPLKRQETLRKLTIDF